MAESIEVSSSFKDFRQFRQDFLAPEQREIRVKLEVQGKALEDLLSELYAGFEKLERRLETYEDVQELKQEMAELRGERRARKSEPAA